MADLNATQLASKLGLSTARISQLVSEGKLEGCYVGAGRARRFDQCRVAEVLGKRLDIGQMSGNGRSTRRALMALSDDARSSADQGAAEPAPIRPRVTDGAMDPRDPDRLELATIQIKEEEARRRRRDNARDEGLWVLAEEVERHTSRALSQEIARFELALRDGARALADRMGIDYRTARAVLMETWRDHRGARAKQLAVDAEEASMSDVEHQEQV